MTDPTPEEVLREVVNEANYAGVRMSVTRDQALAALDQLLQERDDRAAERDLAWEARDGWRAASDEKLAENARLRAEVKRVSIERDIREEAWRGVERELDEARRHTKGLLTHAGVCDRRHHRGDGYDCAYVTDAADWLAAHPVEGSKHDTDR